MYRCLALLALLSLADCYTIAPTAEYGTGPTDYGTWGTVPSDHFSSSAPVSTEPLEHEEHEGVSECGVNTYWTETGCEACPANTNSAAGSWNEQACVNVCLWGNQVAKKKMRSGRKGTLSNTLYPTPGYGSNSHCYWTFERPGLFETVYMVIEVEWLLLEPDRDQLILSRNYVGTGEEKTILTSEVNGYGEITMKQTADSMTEKGTYWWRTTSFDDVNITLIADAEVNGPGFKLKYAFDDCVELEPLRNGHWETEEYEGRLYYKPICDEGYIARRSTEGVKNRSPDLYFKVGVSSRGFPYCDDDTESDNYLKWVNDHYYCAKKLHNCYDLAPFIKSAHLEFVNSPNEHTAHYDVVCDRFGNTVAGPSTLECAIVKEATGDDGPTYDWIELYNEDWLYPRCVARTCDTLEERPNIHVIDSKATYVPGSYLRERCSLNIEDDETRWCRPDGSWTPIYQTCEEPAL